MNLLANMHNFMIALQFKFLAILPTNWQHHILNLIIVQGHNGVMNNNQAKKVANKTNNWIQHNVSQPAQHAISFAITSTLLKPIAHLFACLFWSTGIAKWLADNSPASTVFCTSSSNPNSVTPLENIIAKNPLGLVIPKGQVDIINQVISQVQSLFVTSMIFILTLAIIVAGTKLSESAILNSTEKRQEFLSMSFRTGLALLVLTFLPQILGLLLQLSGVITLAIQQAMMNIHIPKFSHTNKVISSFLTQKYFSGQKIDTLWQVAYTMGADSQSMSAILSSVTGFFFNLAFVLVNLGAAIWVKFYYIWREVAFIILLLLGYIQIPMVAFNSTRNHFTRWCNSMFSVIFIQPINAFVIMLMSTLWLCALEQLDSTNGDISKLGDHFGIMIFMVVILTMFQPLTRVIARQLDLNTGMIDVLQQSSSSALRVAGGVGAGIGLGLTVGAVKGTAGLLTGHIGRGIAGVAQGIGMAGKAAINGAKANNADQTNNPQRKAVNAMAKERQMQKAKDTMKNGAKDLYEGAKNGLKGTIGMLADAIPAGALIKAGGSGASGSTDPLRALRHTLAGGTVGAKTANKVNKPSTLRNLGISAFNRAKALGKTVKGKVSDLRSKLTGNQDNSNGVNASGNNEKANNQVLNNDKGAKTSQNVTNNNNKVKPTTTVPKSKAQDMASFLGYAQHIGNRLSASGYQAEPFINGTKTTSNAFKTFSKQMSGVTKKDGTPYTESELKQQFTNFANSGDAVDGAMRDALRSNGFEVNDKSLTNNPTVPTKPVMNAFAKNLQDLGYSESDAKAIANNKFDTNPKQSDVGSSTTINPNNVAPTTAGSTPVSYAQQMANGAINKKALQSASATATPQSASFNDDLPLTNNGYPTNDVGSNSANAMHNMETSAPIASEQAITPTYLNENIARGADGRVLDNALQAHVNNGMSYITAQMKDGSNQIISDLGQGDSRLAPTQEFVQPLSLNGNGFEGFDSLGQSKTGYLFTEGKQTPYRTNNDYVNKLVNSFNGDGNYQSYNNIAQPLNPLVDDGEYTLAHLKQNPNLSDFAINANNNTSYLTALDNQVGRRVRISPVRSGISDISPQTDVTIPLSLGNGGFIKNGNFTMHTQDGSHVTQDEFFNTGKWSNSLNLNNYMRKVAFNENNYLKNHAGNLNFSMDDFMTDD